MCQLNHLTKNRVIIPRVLFFAGGNPKVHRIPRFSFWGPYVSIYWFDTELVVKIRGKSIPKGKDR